MRIHFFFDAAVAVAMLVPPLVEATDSTPSTYLTITRYQRQVPDQANSRKDMELNSVLRIPKWNRMCVSVMREVTYARPDWDVPEPTKDCNSHLRDFLWKNRETMMNLWSHNTFNGDNDDQSVYPTVFVARLNGRGQLGIVTRDWQGGSGGHQVEWSIYMLNEDESDRFNFPARPVYQGTEFQPGGNVWFQTSCKGNESDVSCARRLFFPSQHAVRLVFAANEVRNEGVGETEALPLDEGD